MDWKKAHFIGVGGVGMSATAKLLRQQGIEVSGSDEAVYPPVSIFLEQEHISYTTPYAAENIPKDVDLIVIGKNAKLVAENNAEVAAAYGSGKQILSFPEVLGLISQGKENIVVAGSYGKSSSAALLSHCLVQTGLDPSYFVGAVPVEGENAHIGGGTYFVMEGDEYPSSNTDPRSKFLYLHPAHLLFTPLAHDHKNIFPTEESYLKPFTQLVQLLPPSGTAVACTEGPLSKQFLTMLERPVVTYGVADGDFHAADITWGEKTSFSIVKNGEVLARVETTQLGEHSVQNIVGVAALLFSLDAVAPEQFAAAVASWKGLKRRLDKKSEKTSIPIFEGFGSSYEKAKSAIAAMRKHFPTRRLLVVFESNTIGWRRRDALPQYTDAFAGATQVYLLEAPHDGKDSELTGAEIASAVTEAGTPARAFARVDDLLQTIGSDMGVSDAILLLSSGPLGGLPESLPALAEQKFPV